jgi:galactonate dehydratase
VGVELNEEACARYPYAPYDVPLFDGSMNTSGVAAGAATFSRVGKDGRN